MHTLHRLMCIIVGIFVGIPLGVFLTNTYWEHYQEGIPFVILGFLAFTGVAFFNTLLGDDI